MIEKKIILPVSFRLETHQDKYRLIFETYEKKEDTINICKLIYQNPKEVQLQIKIKDNVKLYSRICEITANKY